MGNDKNGCNGWGLFCNCRHFSVCLPGEIMERSQLTGISLTLFNWGLRIALKEENITLNLK
jgi:hypothetical protein